MNNKPATKHNKQRKNETVNAWRREVERIEAKLVDIPLPIATLLNPQRVSFSDADATAVMLHYTVKLSVQEVALFYQQEMERSGWQQEMSFVGEESVLVFARPSRSCVITIRSVKQLTTLMIVTGAKRAY